MSPTDYLSASPNLHPLQPGLFGSYRWNHTLARHRSSSRAGRPLPACPRLLAHCLLPPSFLLVPFKHLSPESMSVSPCPRLAAPTLRVRIAPRKSPRSPVNRPASARLHERLRPHTARGTGRWWCGTPWTYGRWPGAGPGPCRLPRCVACRVRAGGQWTRVVGAPALQ
jgi:hypothetical protein